MAVEARFWGTRGSIPSPGPHTVRHGGNTSCVEVRTPDGGSVILDAGTGIRSLATARAATAAGATDNSGTDNDGTAPGRETDIFITHAHWDHIQGLPFFAPLYDGACHVRIWTAPTLLARVERALRSQMAPDVFPVPFEEVRATVEFLPVPEDGTTVGGLSIATFPLRHPGGAVGFRVSGCNEGEGTLVYIPDNELYPGAPYDAPPEWRSWLVRFIHGADLLIHDAMYTAAEYPSVVGWGHSTVDEAVELAAEAGVPKLMLFHHHPERHDDAMDEMVELARESCGRLGGNVEIAVATEGARIRL